MRLCQTRKATFEVMSSDHYQIFSYFQSLQCLILVVTKSHMPKICSLVFENAFHAWTDPGTKTLYAVSKSRFQTIMVMGNTFEVSLKMAAQKTR